MPWWPITGLILWIWCGPYSCFFSGKSVQSWGADQIHLMLLPRSVKTRRSEGQAKPVRMLSFSYLFTTNNRKALPTHITPATSLQALVIHNTNGILGRHQNLKALWSQHTNGLLSRSLKTHKYSTRKIESCPFIPSLWYPKESRRKHEHISHRKAAFEMRLGTPVSPLDTSETLHYRGVLDSAW